MIKIDKPDPKNPVPLSHFTMPVKLDFPYRSTRILFEKILIIPAKSRPWCPTLPPSGNFSASFTKPFRSLLRGVMMVRLATAAMTLVAFTKCEDSGGWLQCPESMDTLRGIMLPGILRGFISKDALTSGPVHCTICSDRPQAAAILQAVSRSPAAMSTVNPPHLFDVLPI
jgi:hypothetical protein